MKYQTNAVLGEKINKFGCYFCDILEKVEKCSAWTKHFSNEDVKRIFNTCVSLGYMDEDCTVLKSGAPEIFNTGADFLGVPWCCTMMRDENPKYICEPGEEEIMLYTYRDEKGVSHSHYMSGNGNGEIEFDSIEGGSQNAKRGRCIGKRIFKVVNL